MSKTVIAAMGMLAALSIAAPARAALITDVVNPPDTYIVSGSTPSPCPSGFVCGPGSLSYEHRITDDGFNIGDTITSASLMIHLGEIVTTGVNHETYRYDFGTQTFECLQGNCVPNSGVADYLVLNGGSLDDLAADGVLRLTISALSGGFLFVDSLLTAEVTPYVAPVNRDPAPVPVPPTLLLLAIGLAAIRTITSARSMSPE